MVSEVASTDAPAAPAAKSEDRGYKSWLLFVLFLVCLFNYADRSVVSSMAGPLRADLHLNDTQFGLLQGISFALLYCLLGIPFAWFAERHSRVKILGAATAFWSVATMLCGAAMSFPQLLLTRMGVGVGEAGFISPASSLIGDHFPRNKRAMATSFMSLGVPFGALIGAVAGGAIAQAYSWRLAFVVMGAPGLIVALLVWFTLRDPERGAADREQDRDAEAPPFRTVAAGLLRNKTFLHVVAGGALAGFGMQGFSSFFGLYYARMFNLAPAAVGLTFGLISFANVAGGLMLSTWLANWGAKRDLRWYAWISAIGTLLSSVLYIAAFSATGFPASVALLVIAGIVLMSYYGPAVAMAQNVATSRTRASTVAVYQLVVNLFGMGFGPLVIGLVSDKLAARAYGGPLPESCKALTMDLACRTALSTGLRQAFMLTTVFFVWASLHYFLAGRSQPKGAQ